MAVRARNPSASSARVESRSPARSRKSVEVGPVGAAAEAAAEPDDPGRRREIRRGQQAARGLDDGQDAEPAGRGADRPLVPGQQFVDVREQRRCRLGQHHAGHQRRDGRRDVRRRGGRVDPDPQLAVLTAGRFTGRRQPVREQAAGAVLLRRGDRVLQVQDERVRAAGRRPGQPVRPVRGHVEVAAGGRLARPA
jgi:hypothetical protein